MLLVFYPSIRGEDFTDDTKKFTCNLLHAYIDLYSQILFNGFPGDGVQAISILKSQC